MQQSRFTKIAVRATAALAALLLGMAALSVLERRRTQAELGAVLSAFFSDAVLRDIHESGSGRGIQVIVLREGPRSAFWRARWLNLLLDRKSTRLNSSHDQISYAVFCLKKKTRASSSIEIATRH